MFCFSYFSVSTFQTEKKENAGKANGKRQKQHYMLLQLVLLLLFLLLLVLLHLPRERLPPGEKTREFKKGNTCH